MGPRAVNSEGSDDATMLTIAEHGTDYQKETFLPDLINGGKARLLFHDGAGSRRRRDRHANRRRS